MKIIYRVLTALTWLIALTFPYEPYTVTELFVHLFFLMALALTLGDIYDCFIETRARKAWELEVKSDTRHADNWNHTAKSSVKRTHKRRAKL